MSHTHRPRHPDDLPRAPSGRVPQWVRDAHREGLSGEAAAWNRAMLHGLDQRRRPPRRRRVARVLVALTVVGVVALAGAGASGHGPLTEAVARASAAARPGAGVDRPLAPGGSSRVLPEVVPAVTSDSHAFVAIGLGGAPVRHDPCQPLPFVIRPAGAPPGTDQLVVEAARRVTAASGLQLAFEGTTDEAPSAARAPYQRDRYGDRWAPVLVAWSDPSAEPELDGAVAGLGGSTVLTSPGGQRGFVSGQITLDAPQLSQLLVTPGGEAAVRAVVQHEMAHVLGLAHVDDPEQLMNPEGRPGLDDFAAGDLTGLAALGAGTCLRNL